MANLEQALPFFAEAARIYRVSNRVERIDGAEKGVIKVQEALERATIERAAAAASSAAASSSSSLAATIG